MEQNQLAIRCWIYFCFNYWNINDVVSYIAEKTGNKHLTEHLKEKFSYLYERYGTWAAMQLFYTELDLEKRDALVEYALKEYAPEGMMLSDEEKQLLGI